MGRPKGSKNKPKSVKVPVTITEEYNIFEDETKAMEISYTDAAGSERKFKLLREIPYSKRCTIINETAESVIPKPGEYSPYLFWFQYCVVFFQECTTFLDEYDVTGSNWIDNLYKEITSPGGVIDEIQSYHPVVFREMEQQAQALVEYKKSITVLDFFFAQIMDTPMSSVFVDQIVKNLKSAETEVVSADVQDIIRERHNLKK